MQTTTSQLCTFQAAGLLLGLEVVAVQEVLSARELSAVPLSSPAIAGLLNLRGQIVTAIDLRLRLRIGSSANQASERRGAMFIIIRDGDEWVALVVDAVGDVVEVEPETFEPPPSHLPAAQAALIRGVHKLSGRLLHLIDVRAACQLGSS